MDDIIKFEKANNKFNELKEQFREQSQLKSDFDVEKFTIASKGPFIAHQFHMLMRQYSLTLGELRRMTLDLEECNRDIARLNDKWDVLHRNEKTATFKQMVDGTDKTRYFDIEINRLQNQADGLELNIVNKYQSCEYFEKCRIELIKKNGGSAPTNEQHQAEEPEYWRWWMQKAVVHQRRERDTGVKESIWMQIDYLEAPATLNMNYQVDVLNEIGDPDYGKYLLETEQAKGKVDRVALFEKIRTQIETETKPEPELTSSEILKNNRSNLKP